MASRDGMQAAMVLEGGDSGAAKSFSLRSSSKPSASVAAPPHGQDPGGPHGPPPIPIPIPPRPPPNPGPPIPTIGTPPLPRSPDPPLPRGAWCHAW
ncbi:hypothetical protein M427DRAFT_56028 [Gonapodya prolifera JEL478]|uniref:Uncharacterized protein n=1 Tax=Gonapodya prolifera (strain JEL478) TaxID=1344416 RepID=A0A139AHA9_GONPJ|nr:hypothetical protein M427DRAFT_56028 [Gonapodya prolifera JEL478]|eukprot:KXS16140.1 hypothetical protein M427DRAFT_56028 [Gonapodya prolifera JEL478]